MASCSAISVTCSLGFLISHSRTYVSLPVRAFGCARRGSCFGATTVSCSISGRTSGAAGSTSVSDRRSREGSHMLAYFDMAISWGELLKRTYKDAMEDDIFGLAAQLAYYFFLALFPAILCLLAIASFFPLHNFTDD